MGIFSSVVLYRTDAGKVIAVTDMETTHLLNAINHHRTQVATIDFVKETLGLNTKRQCTLNERQEDLIKTISALAMELASRGPDEEAIVSVRQIDLRDDEDFLHNERNW